MFSYSPGTPYSDARCECDKSSGYFAYSSDSHYQVGDHEPAFCVKRKWCAKMEESDGLGGCKACPYGMVKNAPGYGTCTWPPKKGNNTSVVGKSTFTFVLCLIISLVLLTVILLFIVLCDASPN